jgi:hypothetical protein
MRSVVIVSRRKHRCEEQTVTMGPLAVKTKAGLGAVISWANLLSIQRTKVNYETPT